MYKIIQNKQELLAIEEEWNNIAKRFQHPLFSFDWFYSIVCTFHNNNFFILVTFDGNDISAIAPLIKHGSKKIYYLEIVGYKNQIETCTLLYKDNKSKKYLLNCLLNLKIPIVLNRIPEEYNLYNDLKKYSNFQTFVNTRKGSKSGVVIADEDWSQRYNKFTSRRKYQYRRIRRKISKFGEVDFQIHSPNVNQLDNYFNELIRVESSGWKGRTNTALKFEQSLQNFYKMYAIKACKDESLKLFVLKLSKKIIAIAMCIEKFNTLWELKIGFDDHWAKYSPGTQLTFEIMRYAYQNNYKSYDFLGSFENWQLFWVNEIRKYEFITIYPSNIRGFLKFSADVVTYLRNYFSRKLN